MGLACIENVSAQYIFEKRSESITMRLDRASRWAFPATFVIGTALLLSASSVSASLVIACTMPTLLGGSLSIWTSWQILNFPKIATQTAIRHYAKYRSMVSPTRRLVPFAFPTDKEMNHLFHAIDKMNPPELELITIEQWIGFICSCDKDFQNNLELQQILSDEMVKRFGAERSPEAELTPDEFREAFGICIRVIGELKRTGKVTRSVDRLLRAESLKQGSLKQHGDWVKSKAESEEEFDEDAVEDEDMAPEQARHPKDQEAQPKVMPQYDGYMMG